jgi:hypothetical protein
MHHDELAVNQAPVPERSQPSLLANVRDVAFAAAIYLFFCGYIYRSRYFQDFGLPSTASISDGPTFFVYSYNVLARFHWQSLAALIAIVLIYLAVIGLRKSPLLRTSIACVGAICAFPALALMANAAADGDAATYKSWSSVDSTVTVGLKDVATQSAFRTLAGKILAAGADNHEMRLFALSSEAAYFTDRMFESDGKESNLMIYIVPMNEISHLEINQPRVGP